MFTIQILKPRHAKALNNLLKNALKNFPSAFTTDYSQIEYRPDKQVAQHLRQLGNGKGFRLGAFDTNGDLVGTVRLIPRQGPRLSHSADVVFLFVRAEFQNQGVGSSLLKSTIDMATEITELKQLELSVSSESTSAIQLYQSAGFEATGVLKKHIRIDNEFFDLITMWKSL